MEPTEPKPPNHESPPPPQPSQRPEAKSRNPNSPEPSPSPEQPTLTTDQLIEHFTNPENAANFFQGFGELSFEQIRQKLIPKLARHFDNVHPEDISYAFRKALQAAQEAYNYAKTLNQNNGETANSIYPETYYHSPNHVEQVMTNTLLIITALKTAADHQDLSIESTEYLEDAFGTNWRQAINQLDFTNVKLALAYSAFHEAGEWWSRIVSTPESLNRYRQFTKEKITELHRKFGLPQNRRLTITHWSVKKRPVTELPQNYQAPKMEKPTTQKHDTLPPDLPATTGYVTQDGQTIYYETDFHLTLTEALDQDPDPLNFLIELELQNPNQATHLETMARILRAADLLQTLDTAYLAPIKVQTPEGETKTLPASSPLLYLEMLYFMPHAPQSYGWHQITDARPGEFFVNQILDRLNLPPGLLHLLDELNLLELDQYFTRARHSLGEFVTSSSG